MNWQLADKVKDRLRPGMRVYAYARTSEGRRKKLDAYNCTRDANLISAEFESFLQEVEPSEIEVRDSGGYVTSCRLKSAKVEAEGDWMEDIDPDMVAGVLAVVESGAPPRQIIGQLLSMLRQKEAKP